VKLQRVPMDLLIALAEKPGELVLRRELSRVWESSDAAEVELSINTGIRKVRQALGDDAERPRFIVTVPGKGYRFIADVTYTETPAPAAREQAQAATLLPAAETPATSPLKTRPWVQYAAALAVLLLAPVPLRYWNTQASARPIRIAPLTSLPGAESMPSISPDGANVVFAWDGGGHGQHLYTEPVAGRSETKLTDSPGSDMFPSWSPDGKRIAFLRRDDSSMALFVIQSSGGEARLIRRLSGTNLSRISWAADAKAIAVVDSLPNEASPPAIFLIRVDSGEEVKLTDPPRSGLGDWQPVFSPGGSKLAFVRNTGSFQTGTPFVLPVNGDGTAAGSPAVIRTDRSDLGETDWSADGLSLICTVTGGLVRIPLQGGVAEPLPFQDATFVSVARRGERLVFAHSVSGTAIFRARGPGGTEEATKLITSSRYNGSPQYSPDGRRITLVSDRTGADELWLTDSEGRNPRKLTSFRRATLGSPRWAPDSNRIAFDSTADGPANVYVTAADGRSPQRITFGEWTNVRPSWSHDGEWIYFGSNRTGAWEIWKTSLDGSAVTQITHHGGREAMESRDGSYLYYTKLPSAMGIWRIPVSGGQEELISPNGVQGRWDIGSRGLYYLNGQNGIEMLELPGGMRTSIQKTGLREDGRYAGF
jgi:Tol biopolymer transport system component/DNA-binding winged helix-turn-helix (wHTH) protein